jgi:peptidoglycan lytic transglycosylase
MTAHWQYRENGMPVSTRRSNLAGVAIAATVAMTTLALTTQASTPDAGMPTNSVMPINAVTPTKSSELAAEQATSPQRHSAQRLSAEVKAAIDRSGKKRVGKASFYAHMFAGRKMADGKQMDPQHDNAASRTLPLGTTAKVTNLETGKSAFVTIQDRGPYVAGRIVDLSPSTAREIGISYRQGVARVEVSPLAVPLPNGGVKLGAAGQATLARNDRSPRPFPPVGW